MTHTPSDPAQLRVARLTGAMYLLQMTTGVFTQVYARGSLLARGDPTQTAHNIVASEQLFRIGIASDLVTYLAVLVATWGLYVLLRPVDRNLAALAVFFRLIELSLHFNSTLNSLTVLRLLSSDPSLSAIDPGELHALAQLAINVQGTGVTVGFIPLGLGSAVFAYLFLRSRCIPGMLAGWGVFASLLMSVYVLATIVFPQIGGLQLAPMLPMGIYEISLGLWLLLKGVNPVAVRR